MKTTLLLALPLVGVLMSVSARGETNEELVKQVRDTETAFAKTMADRKIDAFAKFVSDEAIFYGRSGVMRGRAEVVEGWKGLFEGEKAAFSWAPESVEVLASGTLALSSGPVTNPEGKVTGMFNSIWRREKDGRWLVIFDKGCPVCDSK